MIILYTKLRSHNKWGKGSRNNIVIYHLIQLAAFRTLHKEIWICLKSPKERFRSYSIIKALSNNLRITASSIIDTYLDPCPKNNVISSFQKDIRVKVRVKSKVVFLYSRAVFDAFLLAKNAFSK